MVQDSEQILLGCTTLLFAVTSPFVGHSTFMAIFSAHRIVEQASYPHPEGNHNSSSNRHRFQNNRGTSISMTYTNGKCMSKIISTDQNRCLIGKYRNESRIILTILRIAVVIRTTIVALVKFFSSHNCQ